MLKPKAASYYFLFVLFALLSVSCKRHFSVQNNQYQQYGIDLADAVDSTILNYYMPYKHRMEAEMSRVIGESERELTKPSTPETLIGNFYADAILSEAIKVDPAIQFSMPTTKGGIRNSLPKGRLTVENMFELMPFENELVRLKLSGGGVQKLTEFVAASGGQPVAGITMKVRDKKPYDVRIAGKPFDITQSYIVITSDYLANSGDDQAVFANPLERRNINKKVRDALIDYVAGQTKLGKKINTQLDGRVTVTND